MSTKRDNYFHRSGKKLLSLIEKHLSVSGKNEDVKFGEHINEQSVDSFYTEYLASVRPSKLRPEKILPRPASTKLRGLYLGSPTPNSLLNNLVRHSLYVDQILLTDPFQSIVMLDSEKNVRQEPGIWLETVINNAIAIQAISDWIEADIVRLIPNPFYYYRDVMFKSADMWVDKGVQINEFQQKELREEIIAQLLLAEDQDHWDQIFKYLIEDDPLVSESDKERIFGLAKAKINAFPVRFQVTDDLLEKIKFRQGHPGTIISFGGGIPIHLAPEVSKLTGSFMLFENQRTYDILIQNFGEPSESSFENISLAFQDLEFPFLHNVPISIALQARKEGYLHKFRSYLRDVWSSSLGEDVGPLPESQALTFIDRLEAEYHDLKDEWDVIKKDLRLSAIEKGAKTGASAIVAGSLNWAAGAATMVGSLASAVNDYRKISKRINAAERNPLAVFVDLSKKSH